MWEEGYYSDGYSTKGGHLGIESVDSLNVRRLHWWKGLYPNPSLEVFCNGSLEVFGSDRLWLPKVSWYDRNKGTIGLVTGIVIGVGVTIIIANAVN